MKFICFIFAALFFFPTLANAGTLQYMGTGKNTPDISISFSRNNGTSWTNKVVKHGQTFSWPPDTTNLLINNVPYDPKSNYKVKDGHIFK